MAYIKLRVCDFCGKRIDKFKGVLTLILYAKSQQRYPSNKTIWSKSCCNKCFLKLSATQTQADEIREELDEHIDKRRLENKFVKLLQ
jgi:ribosomal protein L24E